MLAPDPPTGEKSIRPIQLRKFESDTPTPTSHTLAPHSAPQHPSLSTTRNTVNSKGKGGRGKVQGKREGPRENWEKVQVLWICRGVGVLPSRVIRDEYRI